MRSKIKSNDMVKARVLKACANGARGTSIGHKASPDTMKVISYLSLIDEGLIEVNSAGSEIVHRTTSKGLDLIEKLERFHPETNEQTSRI
jgi:predicted transcriptional regulator